jgi:hypothetical protein
MIGAVMMIVKHHEKLLVADEEPRLTVGGALGRLGQREADLAQPLDR